MTWSLQANQVVVLSADRDEEAAVSEVLQYGELDKIVEETIGDRSWSMVEKSPKTRHLFPIRHDVPNKRSKR